MQRMPAGADPSPDDADDSSPARPASATSRRTSAQNADLDAIIGDHLADLAAKNLYPAEVARALTRADLQIVAAEPTPARAAGPS